MGKIVATPVTKSLYLAYIKTPIIQLEKRQFNKKKKMQKFHTGISQKKITKQSLNI